MGNKKTVMLVDDDATFVEATKIVLENHFDVVTAKNGKECLEKVKRDKPDIILLDVMMSHLGEGIDVSNKLKSSDDTKKIPIIMLTGVNEVYDISTQVDKSQLSHDLWLEKPVDDEKLLKSIKKFVG